MFPTEPKRVVRPQNPARQFREIWRITGIGRWVPGSDPEAPCCSDPFLEPAQQLVEISDKGFEGVYVQYNNINSGRLGLPSGLKFPISNTNPDGRRRHGINTVDIVHVNCQIVLPRQ
jgi:hypothetical protein